MRDKPEIIICDDPFEPELRLNKIISLLTYIYHHRNNGKQENSKEESG